MSAESPSARELRRARNIVKKWENTMGSWQAWNSYCKVHPECQGKLYEAIMTKRYERALALILAQKLSS